MLTHVCLVCVRVSLRASLACVRPTQHLVEKSDTHEQFALKRIDLEAQSPSEKKATLLEVRLLSRLVHPYIISLVDHFQDGNSLCLVMPLAPDDLDKELRRTKKSGTRLAEARVLDLLAEVGAALHYLHGCRVVHRDLKPANVLLAEDGTARLADLGIACTLAAGALQLGRALKRSPTSEEREEATPAAVTTLQGTPFYMAPELFHEALHMDGCMFSAASDVWALGVLLYELCQLRRPYSGESVNALVYSLLADLGQNAMTDLMRKDADGQGAALFPYSRELGSLIESMLQKRPRQRATLATVLDSHVLLAHERGGVALPPLIDLLEAKAQISSGLVPDCYCFGRGTMHPTLRSDLMGILVKHVACGAAHCALVTDGGELLTWGDNACGQLGHGDKRHLKRQRPVAFTKRTSHGAHAVQMATVACGRSHTLALSRDGRLYACGSDKHGQLGLGAPLNENGQSEAESEAASAALRLHDAMGCVLSPSELSPPPKLSPEGAPAQQWAVVVCGERHSAALTTSGWAYAWGCAEDGRLGVHMDDEHARIEDAVVSSPQRVPCGSEPLVAADCGDDFTAFLDEDGALWGCGANWNGQLGLTEGEDEYVSPVRLLTDVDEGVESVSCGADHMAAIDGLGRLWVWGGRFGDAPQRVPLPAAAAPPDLPQGAEAEVEPVEPVEPAQPANDDYLAEAGVVEDGCALVACGTGMIIVIGNSGAAFAWGDGAGGRLGIGDGGQEHEAPQRVAGISTPGLRVQRIACGRGGSDELDEGPLVLAMATPEAPERLSDQFATFLRESGEAATSDVAELVAAS